MILILFLFALYLFPNGSLHVPEGAFHYVDDLSTIGQFSWRTAVYRLLHSQLFKAKRKLQVNENIRFDYIDGCTVILLVSITSVI